MISVDYTLFLVILNFLLLLLVLNKLLYKPLKQFLTDRANQISNDMDEAKKSIEKADELVKEKESDLRQAMQDSRKMKDQIRKEAENQANDILNSAKVQEKKILIETEAQLELKKIKATQDIEENITALVTELSSKVLAEKMDKEMDSALIQRVLADRGEK